MCEKASELERAQKALGDLIKTLACNSSRVAHELGVDFDVDDPRVARWMLLATFEGMLSPSTKSTSAKLLERAAAAPIPGTASKAARRKAAPAIPLIRWEDLVASVAEGDAANLVSRVRREPLR